MTPDQLAALHARCFTLPPPWDARAFTGFLSDPTCHLTCDGTRAFVLLRHVAGEVEVLTLATDPTARRQGLARAVLKRALSALPDASACFLEVAEPNNPARALYGSLGFAQVGRRRGYYHTPDGLRQDALVLQATLPLTRTT
jgi:[ribosomal protein S18]-alanine N-acetyltransferase